MTTGAITYGLSFATFTSMVTHVLIWHWKDIRKAITNPVHDVSVLVPIQLARQL